MGAVKKNITYKIEDFVSRTAKTSEILDKRRLRERCTEEEPLQFLNMPTIRDLTINDAIAEVAYALFDIFNADGDEAYFEMLESIEDTVYRLAIDTGYSIVGLWRVLGANVAEDRIESAAAWVSVLMQFTSVTLDWDW